MGGVGLIDGMVVGKFVGTSEGVFVGAVELQTRNPGGQMLGSKNSIQNFSELIHGPLLLALHNNVAQSLNVGLLVGVSVGTLLGECVGIPVGASVGDTVGEIVGALDAQRKNPGGHTPIDMLLIQNLSSF